MLNEKASRVKNHTRILKHPCHFLCFLPCIVMGSRRFLVSPTRRTPIICDHYTIHSSLQSGVIGTCAVCITQNFGTWDHANLALEECLIWQYYRRTEIWKIEKIQFSGLAIITWGITRKYRGSQSSRNLFLYWWKLNGKTLLTTQWDLIHISILNNKLLHILFWYICLKFKEDNSLLFRSLALSPFYPFYPSL